MVTAKLPGLHRVKSRGRIYYYAWRGGPRIGAPFNTPEFLAEFAALKAEQRRLGTGPEDKHLFGTWITLYKASHDYRELSDATKRVWGPWLDRVRDHFGPLSLRQFDRPQIRADIRRWRDQWRDTPRTADYAKQVLSRVLSYAVAEGELSLNPCRGIPNIYRDDRSDIIWTNDDLARFCAVASPEIARAARLASLTGLRKKDLLALSWSRVGALTIDVATSKSRGRRRAEIPITPALSGLLGTIPRGNATTVLTSSAGTPWTLGGFGASWRKAFIRAWPEGKDLHFHDLRGTAATNFYAADLTLKEIAKILGLSPHKVERILDRYVKRDELVRRVVQRLTAEQNGA